MGDEASTTTPAPRAKKAEPKRSRIRFKTGANIGSSRYEIGDVAAAEVIPPATRAAWLAEGLIVEVD